MSSPAEEAPSSDPAAAETAVAEAAAETAAPEPPAEAPPAPVPAPVAEPKPEPAVKSPVVESPAAAPAPVTAAPPATAPVTEPATESAPAASSAAPPAPLSRTAEIWSTRLHKEILALTGEGGDDPAHAHDADTVGVLPPFITLDDHTIDISKGLCDVTFRIEVEPPSLVPGAAEMAEATAEDGEDAAAKERNKEEAKVDEEDKSEETGEGGEAKNEEDKKKEEDAAGTESKPDEEKAAEVPDTAAATADQSPHVIVMLDASTGTSSDPNHPGPAATPNSYPFQPPTAMLISGARLFPRPGSDINDGDYLDIDLDWTPSLHLNDAVLNVALKVRESIRRGEPFYAKAAEDGEEGNGDGVQSELVQGAKKVSSFLSSGLTTLKQGASNMAAVAGEVVAPHNIGAAAGGGVTAVATATAGDSTAKAASKRSKKKAKRSAGAGPDKVAIGNEIDLAESPWNVCAGMYSCKAIRRPEFVSKAMAMAEAEIKEEEKNASPGKAGSLFSTFKQSAKSVLEESFLMISDIYIIEIKTNKFSIGTGKVTFVTLIANLAKLKFRREESISLFLKQAPDDPLIYMMPESADCVKQIQTVLKAHGVKGKHTNAAMQRSIQTALSIVADIQKKEKALEDDPTIDNVNEIMDLCRQAAERFEQAGDPRHKEVMTHMKKFLSNPITTSILNGSYEAKKKPVSASPSPSKPVPEGEVLSSPEWMLNEVDDDDDKKKDEGAKANDNAVLEQADTMLKEAKKDMEQLGVSGASALDDILNTSADGEGGDSVDDDAMAELDAMFADADAELADLMKE